MEPRLLNIQFFRGDAEVITPKQVWAELAKIAAQQERGLQPTGPVHSAAPKVDVRKLVERL